MRLPTPSLVHDSRRQAFATALIGVGVLTLVVAAGWPHAPVVSAMAIIALGATEVTIARFRANAAFVPVVLLHGTIYASLYAVFVGATLASTNAYSGSGIGAWSKLDLAVSVLPMAILARRIFLCLRQSFSSHF